MSIEERPKNVFNRETFGHWELDSIVGAQGTTSTLLVLSERKARITILQKTDGKTQTNTVNFLDTLERYFKDKFPYFLDSNTIPHQNI